MARSARAERVSGVAGPLLSIMLLVLPVSPNVASAQVQAEPPQVHQTQAHQTQAHQTQTPADAATPAPAVPVAPAAAAPASPMPAAPAAASPVSVTDPVSPPAADPPVDRPADLPRDLSPLGMFLAADIVVKIVMVGLALASILTWTVWLAKTIELAAARRRIRADLDALENSATLDAALARLVPQDGAVTALARAAAVEMDASSELAAAGIKERILSRLERIEAAASRQIARGTGILATIGSTAPFVGLFGTVWGIMNSFIGISKAQTTNLAVVAPGIAEALLATALGLIAAIPAVMIYNAFARQIAAYRGLVGDAAAAVLRLAGRDLDRHAAGRPRATRAAAE
ncbi:tonB-system energizer ExbB [Blastochloris sulfoviridis]|uniref:Biopolymer transport protein ExbB n=2 Tax=Blastochloris sulfoviridis TaxID=50712 RepID=A0A5M6I2G3_9HYPH|nr:tonB-system energizer ExbB [Blastochloris sulfoviridis]KAA5601968.1 tonB-system energizer ExbB [Blastochloris sulfoviridis]